MPMWTWNWVGGAVAGGLTLAITLVGELGRMVYTELRGRIERAEARVDEVHARFARREDIIRELEGIRLSFAEVFSELRRANEGIAALRGGHPHETDL